MNTRRSRARGMMIFELMIALGLLATFALIATKLMTTSMRLTHDATAAQDRSIRFEAALGVLRADVWGSTGSELRTADTAWVTRADGSRAVWTIDAEGGLSRTLSAADGRGYPERRSWGELAPGLKFEQAGGVLMLAEPVVMAARPKRNRKGAEVPTPVEVRRLPIVSLLAVAEQGEKQ